MPTITIRHVLVELTGRPDPGSLVTRVRERKAAAPSSGSIEEVLRHLEQDRR